ncbi:MAG TPA: Xaa-Pro peptidase family protein, partial [Tepidisphaeraceae bacterium]|nr:Xaa-Pro peptidase family protein [Tepidisphaeraceae bacterium]
MLDPKFCRQRQNRLLQRLGEMRLDAVVVGQPQHVYYLSGHFTGPLHQSAFILFSDGRSWLVTANSPAQNSAADRVISYQANWNGTPRQEQPAVVGQLSADELKSRRAGRIGMDASASTSQIALQSEAHFEAIDPILWQLRRIKDEDEIVLMKRAIECTEAMYRRARQIIEPGIEELRVFNELHAVAVEVSGEPMTALLGNDFRCGSGGGPPRKDHAAKAGELYILDLSPTHRGYFADNARVFSVNRKPTDAQMKAWHAVVATFEIVEKMAKPGVRCNDIYTACDEHFKRHFNHGLVHHLGHGVGLQPHEFPHLNFKWDDVLMEGEIFTAEPGVYSDELAGGIRIENQYLVTKSGVK